MDTLLEVLKWIIINKYKPDHGYIASEDLFENKKISDTEVHWIPLYKVPAVVVWLDPNPRRSNLLEGFRTGSAIH